MTPKTITRDGWSVSLAGEPDDGFTCTIQIGDGVPVAADGPTEMEAVLKAFRAAVIDCKEPPFADITKAFGLLDAVLALALGQEP
jgi:hypothetical protein